MAMPDLRLSAAPEALPVSLDEVKAHLRVRHASEDPLIETFIGAAVAKIDGKSGHLFGCVMPQTWEQHYDCAFPCRIILPLGPLIDVVSIKYVDAAGDVQTLDPSKYDVFEADGLDDAFILPKFGTLWPATRRQARAVTVTYRAGYLADGGDATSADAVPQAIKVAIYFEVADLFRNRDNPRDGLNPTAQALLVPFRRDMV